MPASSLDVAAPANPGPQAEALTPLQPKQAESKPITDGSNAFPSANGLQASAEKANMDDAEAPASLNGSQASPDKAIMDGAEAPPSLNGSQASPDKAIMDGAEAPPSLHGSEASPNKEIVNDAGVASTSDDEQAPVMPRQEPMAHAPTAKEDESDGESVDIPELSLPPPQPSPKAIEARVRRLTKPRADGTIPLPEMFMEQWKDLEGGRNELLHLFEKCNYEIDRFAKESRAYLVNKILDPDELTPLP